MVVVDAVLQYRIWSRLSIAYINIIPLVLLGGMLQLSYVGLLIERCAGQKHKLIYLLQSLCNHVMEFINRPPRKSIEVIQIL